MSQKLELFKTLIWQGKIAQAKKLKNALLDDIHQVSKEDKLGRKWSEEHYEKGYTSYASLSDMHWRTPSFTRLAEILQPEAETFAKTLDWDLRGLELRMTQCWINIMPAGTYHTLHLHPHSALSGTYYLDIPKGSVALKIEDPRMPLYMNAPLRRGKSGLYHSVQPQEGHFVLFESWLRHEVPPNRSSKPRISISFNYSVEEIES